VRRSLSVGVETPRILLLLGRGFLCRVNVELVLRGRESVPNSCKENSCWEDQEGDGRIMLKLVWGWEVDGTGCGPCPLALLKIRVLPEIHRIIQRPNYIRAQCERTKHFASYGWYHSQ
jgi:hypothetical protein